MAAAMPADIASLLFRTEPFNRMDSARRSRLLSQSRPVHFASGEQLFPENQPPADVCILIEGSACSYAYLPGEKEPVFLENLGSGSCVGWLSALSCTTGLRAVAMTAISAMFIPAQTFIEVVRSDPELKKAIFKQPKKGEIWRAVAAEIERRKLGVGSPRQIVEKLTDTCIICDWPEDEGAIAADKSRLWIASGGSGVKCGERWNGGGKGVSWARLIGLPLEQFGRALAVSRAGPPRESLKLFRTSSASSVVKKDAARSASDSRAVKTPVPEKKSRSVMRPFLVTLFAIILVLAGVVAWARRQPVNESIVIQGTLVFAGESRNINAAFEGTLIETRIQPGQRIERGAVIAVIRPLFDEARANQLAATRDNARLQAEFCESVIAGRPVKAGAIQKELADLASEHASLLGELRVQTAIQHGGTDLAGLSADERKRVAAYFSALRENRAERANSTARDLDVRREDLREAEDALREAQSELRVQSEAYAQLRADKNDDAREEYAVAQRAMATLRRGVNQRQEVVNRIRKEIAAMSVANEPEEKNTDPGTSQLESTNAALASLEKRLREYSIEMRQLASESEKTLADLRTENAPR